jgi:hypothetical protein
MVDVRGAVAGILTAALLVVGCAACGAGSSGSAAPSGWMNGMGVIGTNGIAVDTDGRTLSIDVLVPAAKTPHICVRNLAARLQDLSNESVLVEVTEDTSTDRACTGMAVTTVKITLPQPLGARSVTINNSGDAVFIADGTPATSLRHCGDQGCHPLPASCDDASITSAARGTDIQQPVTPTVRACDRTWLVLDLSFTGAPACEGAPETAPAPAPTGTVPPRTGTCPSYPATVVRYVYRASPVGWTAIGIARTGGCADILRAEPAFPVQLCRGLASPGV